MPCTSVTVNQNYILILIRGSFESLGEGGCNDRFRTPIKTLDFSVGLSLMKRLKSQAQPGDDWPLCWCVCADVLKLKSQLPLRC